MSQAILHVHAAETQFATTSQTSDQRKASMTRSSQVCSRNYLPGLRPVVNDLEAYFKDEFVWLAC